MHALRVYASARTANSSPTLPSGCDAVDWRTDDWSHSSLNSLSSTGASPRCYSTLMLGTSAARRMSSHLILHCNAGVQTLHAVPRVIAAAARGAWGAQKIGLPYFAFCAGVHR